MARVSAITVAKYFLHKSEPGTHRAVTHLKLQKMLYYAQGFYIGLRGQKLFDDRIEAWIHGPVCPEIYRQYRDYDFSEIPRVSDEVTLRPDVIEILDMVWEIYGAYTGSQLEYLTHQESPWITARNGLEPWQSSNTEITESNLKDFFVAN